MDLTADWRRKRKKLMNLKLDQQNLPIQRMDKKDYKK